MGDDKNPIDATMKKYKKRMKQLCCCGAVWTVIGLLSLVVGILMLVYFTQYWNDSGNWRRGLAYFGVVLLIIFVVTLAIGIIFFVILKKIYSRMDAPQNMKMFKPPNYAPGEAPYPQQPPDKPAQAPSAAEPLQPGAMPTAPAAGNPQDVNIEISDNNKF